MDDLLVTIHRRTARAGHLAAEMGVDEAVLFADAELAQGRLVVLEIGSESTVVRIGREIRDFVRRLAGKGKPVVTTLSPMAGGRQEDGAIAPPPMPPMPQPYDGPSMEQPSPYMNRQSRFAEPEAELRAWRALVDRIGERAARGMLQGGGHAVRSHLWPQSVVERALLAGEGRAEPQARPQGRPCAAPGGLARGAGVGVPGVGMGLLVVPTTLGEANAFVRRWHRHHMPVPGAKFCVAVADDGGVVHGVAIVGRPVARHLDDGWTLEVNRSCTDGERHANSMLYGAAWRAAKALGYRRLVTYTLNTESGSSLRGAGWRVVGERDGRSWSCPSRPRIDKHPLQEKLLWEAV